VQVERHISRALQNNKADLTSFSKNLCFLILFWVCLATHKQVIMQGSSLFNLAKVHVPHKIRERSES
jgi:hypothetical protein